MHHPPVKFEVGMSTRAAGSITLVDCESGVLWVGRQPK